MNLVITNANILTMDQTNPKAQAAVVIGEYFAFVGSEEEALAFAQAREEGFETLDAQGRLLIPGFNDSHMHFLHYVKAKQSADLFTATSLQEVLARMKKFAEEHPPAKGYWISGEGWNQDYFADEKRFPTAADLDQITKEHPMIIMRACFHIGILNSKAMEILKLDKDKAAEYGDFVDKHPDGTPNGIVREYVLDDIKAAMPAPSVEELTNLLLESQTDLFEQGITSVQSDDVKYIPKGGAYEFFRRLREAAETGDLKVRYAIQALLDTPEVLKDFLDKGYDNDFGNKTMKIACVKLLTDGSMGARTAYMRKPYQDDPSTQGLPIYTQEELDALVYIVHKKNMPAAIHAIGDGAIEITLNAIEKAQKAMPHLQPRHGIVHSQITDKGLLQRIKDLNVMVFVQPIFTYYDMHIVYDRVGKELAETSYAWKTYRKMGIPCAYGTDAPVEKFSTMPNLYCAVTRKDFQGNGPYLPQECVTMEEALEAYTHLGAYATNEEHFKGAVRPGFLADFILLDKNLLELKDQEILSAKVIKTFIGGECVYQRNES